MSYGPVELVVLRWAPTSTTSSSGRQPLEAMQARQAAAAEAMLLG